MTRVSLIFLSSSITSCTAGAVTSVRTPVATENGPPLRQYENCELAPYVYPCSSRRFMLMRLANMPPRIVFMTRTGM